MKKFSKIQLDVALLRRELDELDALLQTSDDLQERKHLSPFFRARKQLSAAIGVLNGGIGRSDLVATELQLFGDLACDVANGDSKNDAFTLVEFENAQPGAVFLPPSPRGLRQWSPRFEHGFSQLVDWAWRISAEKNSDAMLETFGTRKPRVHFMLVVGRDSDLQAHELARMRWRAENITMGEYRMSCLTFDNLLSAIRDRILYWAAGSP